LLAVAFASGAPAAEAPVKISLGMTSWVGYGPLFLARDLGYYQDANIEVELKMVEDSALYMAAQAARRIDGSASTLDEILKYRSDNFCFKAVSVLDDSFGGDGLVTATDVTEISQLVGKRIGLNEGSTSQYWFNLLIEKAGFKESDFHITNLTADDAAAAFIAGRLDAAVTWEPHLSKIAEMHKGKILIDSTATPGAITDLLVLRCDVIEKHPQAVRGLVRALQRAADYIKVDPDKAYGMMAKGVGGSLSSPAAFAKAAQTCHYYDRSDSIAFFAGGDASPAAKVIDAGNRIWGRLGKLKKPISYADLIDPSFAAMP
jgi:NitT/TauT family transport system substrate-binding protein